MEYFQEIIGQDRVIANLQKALASGNINHAYLFMGPSGVGKFCTARALAKAIIISDDPEGEVYWREQVHPDFMLIEKPENKTQIGIEQITRELEPWLALKPYRANKRVVIIKDAHLLSLPAANALLKTLEDPPAFAVMILVADENNLLETIISRCQMMRFAALNDSDIQEYFTRQGLAADQAIRLSRLGQGSISTAQLFAEEEWDGLWALSAAILESLASGKEYEVFLAAEKMEKNPLIMVSLLETILRDIFIFQQTGSSAAIIMDSNLPICQRFKKLNPQKVTAAMARINSLKKRYKTSVNALLLNINISYALLDALQ